MIKIGILPTYNDNKERPFLDKFSFVNSYSKRIIKAGGIPMGILFPDGTFNEKILEVYDGFLIPGGTKIRLYHILTIHYTYINNKPLLGICMGNQAIGLYINIISILQSQSKDINYKSITKVFKTIKEEDFLLKIDNHNKENIFSNKSIGKSLHKVYINKNTKLYNIYKNRIINMPSIHNYVLKNNDDFIINAVSKEDYIEGIEYQTIIGVQFHPELVDDSIFKYFIKECEKQKL